MQVAASLSCFEGYTRDSRSVDLGMRVRTFCSLGGSMHGANKGYTLIEVMVVVAIFAILATIAFPSYLHARNTSWQKACIKNLREIQGAVEQAMLVRTGTIEYDSLFGATGYIKTKPFCPVSRAEYTVEGNTPRCSVEGHVLAE